MGYWESASNGASFAQDSNLIWGDAPADVMDDAIERVVGVFLEDLGRVPKIDEIRAGLEFSLGIYEETYNG